MDITPIITWLAPIISTIIITAASASINAQFAKAQRTADERHAETDAKRKIEEEWRDKIDALIEEQGRALKSVAEDRIEWYSWREKIIDRMDDQDAITMVMLKAQCTQMRSDVIHRAHRYLDDLGCASTEEKDAFWAEYQEYCDMCEKYGIDNKFVDELARRVMDLPERSI